MEPLYDVTIFLSIGLATIVVTVFVIATTFLGRALDYAHKEAAQKAEELRKTREKHKADIQSELSKLRQQEVSSKEIRSLEKQVRKAEKEVTKAEKELKSAAEIPHLLSLRWTVVRPGVLFVAAAVASAVAKAVDSTTAPFWTSVVLWGLGLACLGVGLWVVIQTMGHIQRVGVATEEGLFQKQTEALTRALQAFDESKRPALELTLRGIPYRFKCVSDITLEFYVTLTRGAVARNVVVSFSAPPGFGFPGLRTFIQLSSHPLYANYVSAVPVSRGEYLAGTDYLNSLKLRTPDKAGEYTLAYKLQCQDFNGQFEEFKVVVEDGTPATPA